MGGHLSAPTLSPSRLVPGSEAGCSVPQHGPGHLAWSESCPVQPHRPPHCRPSLPPQCYGLWDHEEDPLSREHDRGHGKEKEPEEEPALLGLQTKADTGPLEEPGVARATTEDDIQVEARDGPPEQPVEMKPNNRSIGLRFRRRKEHAGPRGPAAIGRRPFPPTTPTPTSPTLEPPPQPLSSHALCPEDTPHCW